MRDLARLRRSLRAMSTAEVVAFAGGEHDAEARALINEDLRRRVGRLRLEVALLERGRVRDYLTAKATHAQADTADRLAALRDSIEDGAEYVGREVNEAGEVVAAGAWAIAEREG